MSNSSIPNALYQILDFEKIKPLSAQQTEFIWLLKISLEIQPKSVIPGQTIFTTKKIGAAITSELFQNLQKLVDQGNTQFILPTQNPVTKTLDIQYLQWQIPNDEKENTLQLLITKLHDYQTLGLRALPHTIVYFYKNLSKPFEKDTLNKGLVLMKGEILEPLKFTIEQLQFLILNIQKFYGILDTDNVSLKVERLELLVGFNKGDSSFEFNRLIQLAMNTK